MKNTLIIFFLFASFLSTAQTDKQHHETIEIQKVLSIQEQAWNEGNIEKFMDGYWNSDSLSFVGKNGITYGWKQTLANYKKNYPDKGAMGQLAFTILKKEKLGPLSYLVIGKWQLKRDMDEVGGYFSLIWKKINGKWLIVSDHTS